MIVSLQVPYQFFNQQKSHNARQDPEADLRLTRVVVMLVAMRVVRVRVRILARVIVRIESMRQEMKERVAQQRTGSKAEQNFQ